MEQMEMNRWVWGTDAPFTDHDHSVDAVETLLNENGLSEYAPALFYENMAELLP